MYRSCALCIVLLFVGSAAQAESVSLICPAPSRIAVTKQAFNDPWRAYGYEAVISVPGLSAFGNQLTLMGQGESSELHNFTTATWTDGTFLCWYQGGYGREVLTSVVNFYDTFERCGFPATAGHSHDECYGSAPEDCPLACELKT